MAEAKTKEKTEERVLGNQVLDTTRPTALPAVAEEADLGEYAGAGSEAVRPEDAATPFLVVLQSNSPVCKKSDARYVNGAEEGMFYHSLTKALYDGRTGLEVIDVFFEPLVLRWKPRADTGSGGGFRGAFDPDSSALRELLKSARPNPKRELILDLPDGTQLVNTCQHYQLVRPLVSEEDAKHGVVPSDYTPVVLALGSTQVKKSKDLNARIGLERVRNAAGESVPIPRFGLRWRLTAVPESNQHGSWYGVKFERLGRVSREELALAVSFYKALKTGQRRAVPDEEALAAGDDSVQHTPAPGGAPLGADGKPVI